MNDTTVALPACKVDIILPTYNRAAFLPGAFESIRAQTFTDWELIVVDDGSTDDTREVVERLASEMPRRITYLFQENQGPGVARNTGIDRARGRYIAFFDSDDRWLPHHLTECVITLEGNLDVDWVYGASRIIDGRTGRVLSPSSFYVEGGPRPFLSLRTREYGRLHVFDDPATTSCMILHGLFCGLQNSVLRRDVFAQLRLPPFRFGEDQVFPVMALKARHQLGYFNRVHTLYYVHQDNSSATGSGAGIEKRLAVHHTIIQALEDMREHVDLSPAELAALRKRLSREYFWRVGYALLWQNSCRRDALAMFRHGLRLWPGNLCYWKTYLLAWARTTIGGG